MNRQSVFRSFVFVFLGAFALTPVIPAASAEDEFTVELTTVEDLKAVFATVESIDSATARTRIGGTITRLSVDEGTRVKKGQTVALVEDAKLRLQMGAVQARIQSLEAQRGLAKTELDRFAKLHRSGTISQARLDQAQTNLDVAERQLAAMRAEREVISQQRSEGAVLAPANGRVLKVHVTAGTNVQPGEVVATLAAEAYILRMQLPERHARFIEEGDTVLVGERGLAAAATQSGRPLRAGTIRQVYPEIRQGRVMADVEVEGLGDFFVGERVPVHVSTGTREVFVVPDAFLFQRYGVTYVKLKGQRETVVQTGQRLNGRIEVLSGLKSGDVLLRPEADR